MPSPVTSIMDFFRGAPPVAAPVAAPPAPATPGQMPVVPVVAAVPGSGDSPVPPVPAPGTPAAADKSPMDAFSDLWKNAGTGSAAAPAPMFNLDPVKMLEAAKTIPFTNAVTPEQMAAISKGGPEATQALQDVMQTVAATTMMQSAITTGNMVETAVKKATADLRKEIPGMVKGQNLRESVATENPALSHPATQPFVNLLQSQMQVKFPNATAAELRGMVSQYFDGLAGIIKPPAALKNNDAVTGGNDWSKFLD